MQTALGSSTSVWTAYQQTCLQRKLILPSSAAITQESSLARGGASMAPMLEFWFAWICAGLMQGFTTSVNSYIHQPHHVQDPECHSSQPVPPALTFFLPALPQHSLKRWCEEVDTANPFGLSIPSHLVSGHWPVMDLCQCLIALYTSFVLYFHTDLLWSQNTCFYPLNN